MDGDLYGARADAARALALTGTESAFTITVRFAGGLTPSQQDAFAAAADRWARVVVGHLPAVDVDGEVVEGVLVVAAAEDTGHRPDRDGVLGVAGPTHVRVDGTTCRGVVRFDAAALAAAERDGSLVDVVTREMGHVLGVGTLWQGFVDGAGGSDPRYTGPNAMVEYGRLTGRGPEPVPVENDGDAGIRDSHWRGSVFPGELMSGAAGTAGAISRLTVASLMDLGYQVDLDAAEPYALPAAAVPARRLRGRFLRPPRTESGAWSVGGGGGEMGLHDDRYGDRYGDGYSDGGVGGGGGHIG